MGFSINTFSFFIRILSYSLIFCLKSCFIITHAIKDFFHSIKSNFTSCIMTIMYFGEENLIREKIKKIERKPNHLAVILSKHEYSLYCIVKLIAWCEYSGIKYITIYDPYDYIKSNIENQNNDKNFDKTLKGFFKDVSIIYGQNSELNSIKLEVK